MRSVPIQPPHRIPKNNIDPMLARPVLLIFILFFFLPEAKWAWASPTPAPTERREIRSDKINEYRTQRAFRYEKHAPRSDDLFGWIREWILEMADELTSGRIASRIFDVLQWLLPALILGYAVFRIVGMEHAAPWSKRQKKGTNQQADPGEDIHAVDFETAIGNAESEARYRDAVRLHYLKILKLLTDAGRIQWKPDKTNADYAFELAGTELADGFDGLTYIYDCTWYGDMPVNGDAYTKIKPGFLGFRERLRS
jgi:hypothetical protein